MASPSTRNLSQIYRAYIRAILDHDVDAMYRFVSVHVVHNGTQLGLEGYQELLRRNIIDNGMHIEIKRLITDENHVAAVLVFTTGPSTRRLAGIDLNSQPFSYVENVIYDFEDGKIAEVHSLFDIDTVRSHAREL